MNGIPLYFSTLFCAIVLLITQLSAQPNLNFTQFATGFTRPTDIVSAGDSRLFVIEQNGFIKTVDAAGNVNPTVFLNIDSRVGSSGNEQGLLGLAFHPNYANNGFFYVNYTNNSGNTNISRFSVSAGNPDVANSASEFILFSVSQPYSNHNAGDLNFGPDGYLYVGLGDGGSGGDPGNRSQNGQQLLGKMLRIDVDNTAPGLNYAIPPSNPFVGNGSVRDEIWAIGVRNPWRFSFDRLTGDMWIADVGQDAWEEVNFQAASGTGGENYGWRCYEGLHTYNTSGCPGAATLTMPIHEYPHSISTGGFSITGGFVYRGSQFPVLAGHYIACDYVSGNFWTITSDGSGGWDTDFHGSLLSSVSTFGENNDGEIFAGTLNGTIYHLEETTVDPCSVLNVELEVTGDTSICVGETIQLNAELTGDVPVICTSTNSTDLGTGTGFMPSSSQGTSTPNPSPYFGWYTGARVQYLYRAAELSSAGVTAGNISTIGFFVQNKNSNQPYSQFTLKMKNTSSTTLSGFETGTSTVYGPVGFTTATGWNMHDLDSDFIWDGTSNLLVDICFDNGNNNYSASDQVLYNNPGFNCSFYDYSDNFGSECTLPGGEGGDSQATSNRPNTRFESCNTSVPDVSYQWSPAGDLSNANISNPVASPSVTSTYNVTATYSEGCEVTGSVNVEVICKAALNLFVSNIQSNSVKLNWDCNPNDYGYVLRGNAVGQPGFVTLVLDPGCQSPYTVTGLTANTDYFWQVQTICDQALGLESLWSNPNFFTTMCGKPNPIFTSNITPTTAHLQWTPVSGASSYKIKGRAVGGAWVNLTVNGGATSHFDASGLAPGQAYQWKVRANCTDGGNSGFTSLTSFSTANAFAGCIDPAQINPDIFCITLYDPVCGCDGNTYSNSCFAFISGVTSWTPGACSGGAKSSDPFSQKDSKVQFSVFPNPSSGMVQIRLSDFGESDFHVKVFDVLGKEVKKYIVENSNRQWSAQVEFFAKGSYFVQVKGKNFSETQKIVIR